MTIGQIAEFIFEKGATGVLLVFIAALAVGRLIWKVHHDEVVSLVVGKYETIISELKSHHTGTVADLKQQIEEKDKEIDRWRDMALQQKNLVNKSLDAVVATATEKPAP